jgi:hypothetical protein
MAAQISAKGSPRSSSGAHAEAIAPDPDDGRLARPDEARPVHVGADPDPLRRIEAAGRGEERGIAGKRLSR